MKGNFFSAIDEINRAISEDADILRNADFKKLALSQINSYLGLMRHYDTFTIRKKLLASLHPDFWKHFYISDKYRLIVAKTEEWMEWVERE